MKPVIVRLLPCLAALALAACASAPLAETRYRLPEPAPLSVPILLGAGGAVLVFGVFGVAFLLAAGAALVLPEHTGRALDA